MKHIENSNEKNERHEYFLVYKFIINNVQKRQRKFDTNRLKQFLILPIYILYAGFVLGGNT